MTENGKRIVVPQEATIIIEVYERYNAGETFKQIECIKVMPDRTIEVILKGGIHGKEKV